MTPLSPDEVNARYHAVCKGMEQRDPLYYTLVARIAKDVSWGEAVPDSVYGDGIGPCTLEPHYSNARRVIVELGL